MILNAVNMQKTVRGNKMPGDPAFKFILLVPECYSVEDGFYPGMASRVWWWRPESGWS